MNADEGGDMVLGVSRAGVRSLFSESIAAAVYGVIKMKKHLINNVLRLRGG